VVIFNNWSLYQGDNNQQLSDPTYPKPVIIKPRDGIATAKEDAPLLVTGKAVDIVNGFISATARLKDFGHGLAEEVIKRIINSEVYVGVDMGDPDGDRHASTRLAPRVNTTGATREHD